MYFLSDMNIPSIHYIFIFQFLGIWSLKSFLWFQWSILFSSYFLYY